MTRPGLADLIAQPDAATFLSGVARRGRPANAYLFHGPAGVGKGTAAIAFARALLCERAPGSLPDTGPSLFGDAAPADGGAFEGDACNACGACGKTAALQHPDMRFVFPVSGEEKELEKNLPALLDEWREDPFFVFTYERYASIRIKTTRELIQELAYKPFESARRVVVMRDADMMRIDQYSALLKVIEEPGAATVWILTTARPTRIPATILSRCQRVRFAPLPEPVVRDFLEERVGIANREARMLAALSGGSLSRALTLREEDPLALRDEALGLLAPALRGDDSGLMQAVSRIGGFGRPGRETLRRLIEFQELWLRDLLRARYEAPREWLVNRDREQELRRQAGGIEASEIRRRLMLLEEALRAIEGNVTPELALFSAMSRIADPHRPAPVWPPHATARSAY